MATSKGGPMFDGDAGTPVTPGSRKDALLDPDAALLAKLGSIIVHVEEAMGPHGHPLDRVAVEGLLADPYVKAWLVGMRTLGLLPEPR